MVCRAFMTVTLTIEADHSILPQPDYQGCGSPFHL